MPAPFLIPGTAMVDQFKIIKAKKMDTNKIIGEAPESKREIEKKLNRQARNRRYYLKHQGELQEKARDTYYRLREEKSESKELAESDLKVSTEKTETSRKPESREGKVSVAVPVMVAAATVGIAIAVAQHGQEQQPATVAMATPSQDSYPFDMGGGKIIQIKKS